MPDRRYQVFVSSTYSDLVAERQEVLHTLLELGHFPAGMEFFPASDESVWRHVQQAIRDSDYYIVVVGGRYGSTDEAGISFTEREYDYAVELSKPILAFIYGDLMDLPLRKSELDPELRRRLNSFVDKLQSDRHVVRWRTPAELGRRVAVGLNHLIEIAPSEGWVRSPPQPRARTTAFEVLQMRESMTVEEESFSVETALRIKAAGPGLQVFYWMQQPLEGASITDVEPITTGITLLKPLIQQGGWTKYFFYLGRQLLVGEAMNVTFVQRFNNASWHNWNVHAHYVNFAIDQLELALNLPAALARTEVRWGHYAGEYEVGEVLDAGHVRQGEDEKFVYRVQQPEMHTTYALEWRHVGAAPSSDAVP